MVWWFDATNKIFDFSSNYFLDLKNKVGNETLNSFVASEAPKFRGSPNIFNEISAVSFLYLLFAEKINFLLVNQQKIFC